MSELPKTVILDLKVELREFERCIQPFILGTTITPNDLIEKMWESFFDKDGREESLANAVLDISMKEELRNKSCNVDLDSIVIDTALAICDNIDMHRLYLNNDYLPYNMEVDKYHHLILRRDDAIIEIQNAWREETE